MAVLLCLEVVQFQFSSYLQNNHIPTHVVVSFILCINETRVLFEIIKSWHKKVVFLFQINVIYVYKHQDIYVLELLEA
jgi:hypothetical protein